MHRLAFLVLLAASFAAMDNACAQESVDLTVRGALVSQPCTVDLQNGGNIDMGTVSLSSLNQNSDTILAEGLTLGTSIACPTSTRIAVGIADNREASGIKPPRGDFSVDFSLGTTSGGREIGFFRIPRPLNATVDGVGTSMIVSDRNMLTWAATGVGQNWGKSNDTVDAANAHFLSFGTPAGGPIPLTTANFTLFFSVIIYSRTHLQLTGVTPIDGSATLEIVYL